MATLVVGNRCSLAAQKRSAGRVSTSSAALRSSLTTCPPSHNAWQLRIAPERRASRKVVTMGLFGLGFPEIAVIAGVAVLIFGPSKLPELGKGLGQTVKSFQTAAKEFESELKNAAVDEPGKEDKSETGKAEETKKN